MEAPGNVAEMGPVRHDGSRDLVFPRVRGEAKGPHRSEPTVIIFGVNCYNEKEITETLK